MYLSLARKYRPQKFSELIGQPHISRTLQNAIKMDKFYHAIILSGMKGVGKTTTARILAKALNCVEGPAEEPCNSCEACLDITQDKSPDYMEIDGASNNGIDEVRRLRENVNYKPYKHRFRIVVIDEVHMLSNAAWNALLKTVEEPPEHTIFVMATTDFHKIPATIVSRCQHFEFKSIPAEICAKVLKEICEKESIKVSDYALYLIAKSADGSLRDAKKLLDQSIAISSGDIRDEDVVEILGIIKEEYFINITRDIFNQDRASIFNQVNELVERGIDIRFFYREYLKFFRDLIILKSVKESEQLHSLNPQHIAELQKTLKDVKEIELIRYFNAIKNLETTIRHTENPRIILEFMFLKLSYFPALKSIEDIISQSRLPNASPSPNMERATPAAVTIDERPEIRETKGPEDAPDHGVKAENDDPAAAVRQQFFDQLLQDKPRLASAIGTASQQFSGEQVHFTFPGNQNVAYEYTVNQRAYISDLLTELMGKKVSLKVSREESAQPVDEKEIIKDIKKDKQINNLVDSIRGKIISIDNVKGGDHG